MPNTILIDGNSIGYAAHSVRELTHNGRQVQAIFHSLKMVKAAVEFAGPRYTAIKVLWDHRAKWRFDLYPEYKGKRDDTPEKAESRKQYKAQQPLIRKGLSLLGVPQAMARNEEADDLASALVHNADPNDLILLVSGDQDWLQLVRENVSWYDPREEGRHVNLGSFKAFTGFDSPIQFSQAKAILGDSSDNVKGVDGIGQKSTQLLFDLYGGVPSFIEWSALTFGTDPYEFQKGDLPDDLSRFRKKLSAFVWGDQLAVFKRNMQLMNLLSKRHRSTEILDKQVTALTPYDEDGFVDFCNELAFMSIARSMNGWRSTFKNFGA